MQLGVCVRDLPTRDVVALAREVEDLGYRQLYLPEGGQVDGEGRLIGRDPYASLAAALSATTTLVGAVGVAQAIFQGMPQLALKAATLSELSGGRFHLGVGVSHRELAARFGVPFPASPLGAVRQSLTELYDWRERLRFGNDFPILVGALGPKMVALGASAADGVVLNWLTPEFAARTVRSVREAAGPQHEARSVLYIRVGGRAALRPDAVNYALMANYHQHFVAQGLTDPDAVVAGACIDTTDLGAARAAIDAYADTGLDVLCLYPHGLPAEERSRVLAELAPR